VNYNDLAEWFESRAGHSLNGDEGLRFGNPPSSLRKVLVCWMATVPAIEKAIEWGADLIIAHEAVFQPYYLIGSRKVPEDYLSWKANLLKIKRLAQTDTAVMRVHGTADEISIFDTFVRLLDLPGEFSYERFFRMCAIEPVSVRELACRVKTAVNMPAVRVAAADLDATVSMIGFPWGGLALDTNLPFMAKLVEQGCDCFIAGESDSYGAHFALDSGVALIETGHEVSEDPGLRVLAELLDGEFSDAEFRFLETKYAFTLV